MTIKNLACSLTFAILMAGSLNAQQLGGSTGDYYTDLGAILGSVEAVKSIKDICNEEFPDTADANEKAYSDWRATNLKFLQEVERNRIKLINEFQKISAAKAAEFVSTSNKNFLAFKVQQRQDMASDGRTTFRARCANFEVLTKSQQWTLQNSMAEEVATMRQGPPK
jgi:hypothetical protein